MLLEGRHLAKTSPVGPLLPLFRVSAEPMRVRLWGLFCGAFSVGKTSGANLGADDGGLAADLESILGLRCTLDEGHLRDPTLGSSALWGVSCCEASIISQVQAWIQAGHEDWSFRCSKATFGLLRACSVRADLLPGSAENILQNILQLTLTLALLRALWPAQAGEKQSHRLLTGVLSRHRARSAGYYTNRG